MRVTVGRGMVRGSLRCLGGRAVLWGVFVAARKQRKRAIHYITVRLWSRCRSVFKTREFRFDYLTNMIDGIEKMSFVCWHFLASRILAEISSVKNTV